MVNEPPQSAPRPEGPERVSTGVTVLDTMLHGGLLPGRPYLIVGPSGTGKTTLALEFLAEGVRRGERCLVVTLEEPPNEMRQNHRGLLPELDQVFVFDAVPDVMRYERAPFKDIAAVRESIAFAQVPTTIRKTAELSSVEVTFTALEQTLKMEIARRSYGRIVIDSLTALQYFCMKGFDETLGAQTFLRFLSDLRITTFLTVESPLEDVETPERLLARGEIRLFRWELDGMTVRAIGVEKFRGSEHDIRLHPYRLSPKGLDINLATTISRDTRQLITPEETIQLIAPAPVGLTDGLHSLEQDALDLAAVGVSPAAVIAAVRAALERARAGEVDAAWQEVARARGLVLALFQEYRDGPGAHDASMPARRLIERVGSVRMGVPPPSDAAPGALADALDKLATRLSEPSSSPHPVEREPPVPPPALVVAGTPSSIAASPAVAVPSAPPNPSTPPAPAPEPASSSPMPPGAMLPKRAAPPPLPAGPLPTPPSRPPNVPAPVVAAPAAPSLPPMPSAPPAGAVTPASLPEPVGAPAVSPPTAAPTAAGPVAPAAGPDAAPKRRRKTATAPSPRKRVAKAPSGSDPSATVPPTAVPAEGTAPVEGAVAPAAAASGEDAGPAKPRKRKAPSRRKAPSVTGATPGPPPLDTTSASASAPPPEAPADPAPAPAPPPSPPAEGGAPS